MNIKFVSAVLLMGAWLALVIWHGADQNSLIDAIKMLLEGLGVYHITPKG